MSGCLATAAQFAPPEAAGHLTTAANAFNTVAGATALGAAVGITKGHNKPQEHHDIEMGHHD